MTIPEDGTWTEVYPLQATPKVTKKKQNILKQALPKNPRLSQGDTFANSQTQGQYPEESQLPSHS